MPTNQRGQFFWFRDDKALGGRNAGFLRYNFGDVVTISRGTRNWKAKIVEACLDRDMNFEHWRVQVINWRLWYKMFPSQKCTHWLEFKDPVRMALEKR